MASEARQFGSGQVGSRRSGPTSFGEVLVADHRAGDARKARRVQYGVLHRPNRRVLIFGRRTWLRNPRRRQMLMDVHDDIVVPLPDHPSSASAVDAKLSEQHRTQHCMRAASHGTQRRRVVPAVALVSELVATAPGRGHPPFYGFVAAEDVLHRRTEMTQHRPYPLVERDTAPDLFCGPLGVPRKLRNGVHRVPDDSPQPPVGAIGHLMLGKVQCSVRLLDCRDQVQRSDIDILSWHEQLPE